MGGEIVKIGTIVKLLLTAAYGIYSLILAIQTYSNFSDVNQTYRNIVGNLSQSFIIDVQVSTADQCPDGYNSIFEWDWKGIQAGCNCPSTDSDLAGSGIIIGGCSSSGSGCTDIPAYPGAKFSGVEGQSGKKEIVCVKRTGIKFSDIIGDQAGSCSENQKMCGNPNENQFVICVASSDPCPIYDLIRDTAGAAYNTNEWKEITMASGKSLYINYNGLSKSSFPLSEHRFTQNGVCKLNNDAKQLPAGQLDYELALTQRERCSGDNANEIDDSFKETKFEIAENLYYKLNLPADQWKKMVFMPDFNVPYSLEPFKSNVRSFIPWKIEARSQVKPLVEAYDGLDTLEKVQLIVMVISIFVCLFQSIIMPIFQAMDIIQGKPTDKTTEEYKNYASYVLQAIQFPILLWALISSAQKKGLMNDAANAEPSQPRFNAELKTCAKQLDDDVYTNNLITLLLLVGTILMEIGIVIKDQMDKQEEKVKPEDDDDNDDE